MCRKARLAAFAALVIGLSLRLLTGAQAATLNFGPTSVPFTSTRGLTLGNVNLFTPNPQSGPASFGILNGTMSILTGGVLVWSGYNAATGIFGGVTTNSWSYTASFAGGADTVSGQIRWTSLLGNNVDQATLMGVFGVTSKTGSPDFVNGLPPVNINQQPNPIQWTLIGNGQMSLADLRLAATSGTPGPTFMTSTGAMTVPGPAPIPLPPAIYLFGSVLGGGFWLARRKRSTVSSLGA